MRISRCFVYMKSYEKGSRVRFRRGGAFFLCCVFLRQAGRLTCDSIT